MCYIYIHTFIKFYIFCEDDRPPISERRFTPSPSSDQLTDRRTELIPQPTVTIMVESPQDAPINYLPNDPPPPAYAATEQPDSESTRQHETIIDIDVPIDVNIPRDTTNIFYDYSPEADPNTISYNQTQLGSSPSGQATDPLALPTVMPTATPTVIDIGDVPRTPTTSSS